MGKKCAPCQANKCERDYSNRQMCEGNGCTCTCQEEAGTTFFKGALSIVGGVGLVAGGVAFTVATGGLGAALIGGAVVGAGSSLAINPVAKKISGERQTAEDLVVDVAVGTVAGVATGGIGMAGSVASQGAGGVAKFAARAGAGLVSGSVGGAVSEGGRAIKGEDVTLESVGTAVAFGAISGGIGGASSHAASNMAKVVDSGAGKALTRIAVQTGTGTAVAATAEVISEGGMPSADGWRRIGLAAGSQAVLATTSECASNVTKKHIYHDKYGGKELKSLSQQEIDEQNSKVRNHNAKRDEMARLNSNRDAKFAKRAELSQQREAKSLEMDNKIKPSGNAQEIAAAGKEIQDLKAKIKAIDRQTAKIEKRIGKVAVEMRATEPDLITKGDKKIHFLERDRLGQVAVEPDVGENRGRARSVWNQDGSFVGHTEVHDYENLERPLGRKQNDYSQTFNIAVNATEEERKDEKEKTD